MHKAIFFDLGDTLFDFEPMSTRQVFQCAGHETYEYLKSRGCSLPSKQWYLRMQWWGICASFFWSRLCGREFNSYHLLRRFCGRMKLGMDEAEVRDLAWRWYEPVTGYCTVAEDVIPTLTRLREKYKLAIVSNTFLPGFVLDRHLELHNLLGFFPVRVYSSEVGYRKPHQRIFEVALDAVGVKADETMFVGDTVKADIVGARRAGMRSVVLRQRHGAAGTHKLADHVIRSISELETLLEPAKDANGVECGA